MVCVLFFVGSELTPVICCKISPLEDTLSAGEIGRELEPHLEDSVAGAWVELASLPIGLLQEVSVQAGLAGRHQGVVLRTQPELEVPHVVGGQLDLHLHPVVPPVDPGDGPTTKLSSALVISGLKHRVVTVTDWSNTGYCGQACPAGW